MNPSPPEQQVLLSTPYLGTYFFTNTQQSQPAMPVQQGSTVMDPKKNWIVTGTFCPDRAR